MSSGKYVIANPQHGIFTRSGHFIVLRGLTSDGKILVADPNKENTISGNQACSHGGGGCTTISADASSMKDLNGDGKISYTENSAGFTDDQIMSAGAVRAMWVISKDDIRA